MRRFELIAMSIVLFACCARGPRTSPIWTPENVPPRYARAGPYHIYPYEGEETKARAEIREFIWNHLANRKLGYLEATFYTKEGEPFTHFFFIEANSSGTWQIRVMIDAIEIAGPPIGPGTPHRRTRSEHVVCTVKRTDPPQKLLAQSEEEAPPSSNYRLVLEYCGGGHVRI
jgi:hypothetical protein